MTPAARAHRLRIVLAFAAIYLIWGSTYLAIRWVVEDLPPFVMAGVRFVLAGGALLAWSAARGARWPEATQWRHAAVLGVLFFVFGNGMVSWSEQFVPSGLTAVIIASVPAWVVLLQSVGRHATRPAPLVVAGVVLGLLGIAWLVGPGAFTGTSEVRPAGAVALLLGCLMWSVGTIRAHRVRPAVPPLQGAGMQMLAGGVGLILLGTFAGEWPRLAGATVSTRALLAMVYLASAGSIVAFSAYAWLLRHVEPSRVATYAFVNPIVAMGLGWLFAGETLQTRTLVAAAIIVAGVAMITLARPVAARPAAAKPRGPESRDAAA